MEVKGINIKMNGRGDIHIGVHEETFKAFMQKSEKNAAGFINITLIPHHTPTKQGFSHKAILQEVRVKT